MQALADNLSSVVTDFSQFSRMRADVNADNPDVLREVAGQFEALFVQTLLKNMRDSSLGEPIFGQSDQFEMYQGMLDQQLAVEMSKGRGIGIADMLVQQLGGAAPELPRAAPAQQWVPGIAAAPRITARLEPLAPPPTAGAVGRWETPVEFGRAVWSHAEHAGKQLGIAPESLLAQAALESGWGAHVMQRANGQSSLNLFGIKAGQDWSGDSVSKNTLEFRDGVGRQEAAQFRAYPDLASTFDDYAAFISGKTRYAAVLDSGQDTGRFANALQEAGYATDPDYADKIERIVNGDEMREVLLSVRKLPPINELVSQVSHP